HCQATGGGSCQACFTDDSAQRTRSLSLTACALPTPSQGANYDLRLTVASLSLLATYGSNQTVTISGQGLLDISATLPVFGAYQSCTSSGSMTQPVITCAS